jgi:hypothetical protein
MTGGRSVGNIQLLAYSELMPTRFRMATLEKFRLQKGSGEATPGTLKATTLAQFQAPTSGEELRRRSQWSVQSGFSESSSSEPKQPFRARILGLGS